MPGLFDDPNTPATLPLGMTIGDVIAADQARQRAQLAAFGSGQSQTNPLLNPPRATPIPSSVSAGPSKGPNDYAREWIAKGLLGTGISDDPYYAQRTAQGITNLTDYTPLAIPQMAYSGGQMIGRGAKELLDNPAWSSLGQLGLGVGATALAAAPIIGKAGAEGESLLSKALQEGEAVAGKAPQRGILATPDLRQMSLPDAVKAAKSEPHLIQDKTGQYVGAPRGVTTPDQIDAMRNKFDADVALGAPGGDWYTRAADTNVGWAGLDPARQRLLAQEQAFWSPQASPDPNLGWAFQAHNAYEMGQPLDLVHTGRQARVYQQMRDAGNELPLGPKTEIYGINLDPTKPPSTTGTNDIWHARGFGYNNADGTLFDRALTPQEHRFLDYETVLATDRANANAVNGRTDWTAPELQAAAWVAGKGREISARSGGKISLQEGIDIAKKTYPDFAPKYSANATYEATPAAGINHLPGLLTGSPEDRAAFASTSPWTGNTGRDRIYDAFGLYQQPTLPATGIYTAPGGTLETNPANVARPFVGMIAGGGGVDPASRLALDVGEGARAYVDAQGAGAWHKLIANAPAGQLGSLHVPLPGPLPADKVAALQDLGGKFGVPHVVDSGSGVTLTNFDSAPSGADMGKALKATGPASLRGQIANLLGADAQPTRVKVDSNMLPMFHDWEGNAPAPGSGIVTQKFLDLAHQLQPSARLKLAEGLRAGAASNLSRDAQMAAATGQPIRSDIQNARNILMQPGDTIKALADAARRGDIPLPAIAAGGLGLGTLSLRPWGALSASPSEGQQLGS